MGCEDTPSALPVDVSDAEDVQDVFEDSPGQEYEQDGAPVVTEEADDIFGGGTGISDLDAASEHLPDEQDDSINLDDKKFGFVDTGDVEHVPLERFAHVGRAAPDSVISEAIRLTDKKAVLYPWEKGRMAKVFGDQGRLEAKRPKLHASSNSFVKLDVEVREGLQCTTSIDVRPTRADNALYMGVVKQIIGGSYIEERDAKRDLAVRAWWDLLQLNMRCSDPGRTAMCEKGLLDVYRNGIEILDASMGVKSPNTVMKRLYAVKTYNQWVMRNLETSWIPVVERNVWLYFKALKEEKAPATRATSLLEALRFCHFVFKVDGCDMVLESLRVRGLAAQLYACKRPWRPADPLTVADVLFLHKAMADERRSLVDRVFIGHLIHMVYARARFSDLLASMNCSLDEDNMFFELEAAIHKGSRSAVTKAMLLPVVAPANGITEDCWAMDYIALRKRCGLDLPGKEPSPMLPAPQKNGLGWQSRYLTSQEMNAFMKKLFTDGGIVLDGRRVSTHSCKATCISWCAKHDVSPEHRAVLARHSTTAQGPTALYSRDIITAALRSLVKVLEAVRAQQFFSRQDEIGDDNPNSCSHGS